MASLALVSLSRKAYHRMALAQLEFGEDAFATEDRAASATLSSMDVLRIVQSSLDEIGLSGTMDLVALKLKILGEVSEGRLANAVRLAIVRTGKSRD